MSSLLLSRTLAFRGLHRFPSPACLRTFSSSSGEYDVLVVGGGITGCALLYTLFAFTDVKRIALLERRGDLAVVASHGHNNSQTIHCGDIETNYTLQKAKTVKRHADMLRNYACRLPASLRDKCVYKMGKMALAVGEAECAFMESRYNTFRSVFKNVRLINKQQIADVEPRVAMVNTYTYREDDINAMYTDNEYSAVDYYNLAASFVQQAKESSANGNSKLDVRLNTEAKLIEHGPNGYFHVHTDSATLKARFLVVSACGHSLLLAHRMGYGLQFSCLPIAGSFYFTPNVLNGKVYTVQNPKLPFAAVHGDPDVVAKGKTRFGPTALPLPMLERYNNATVKDFFEVLRPDFDLARVYWDMFKGSTIRNYVLKNFLFEVPVLNKLVFVKDVNRIIPSLKSEDLTYAKGYGGVRPQMVDKENQKILLGEGRIAPEGANILFNITPSPGGTSCLGTAELDAKAICTALGAQFNNAKFEETLLNGEYPVDYL